MIKNLRTIFIGVLLSLSGIAVGAEQKDTVQFAYDVDFDMNFDNREFNRSSFSPSMTIFGTRLTPSIGFSVKQQAGLSHKVMLGVDVMKDFGAPKDSTKLFREMIFYYKLDKTAGKTRLSMQAGIFPRSSMEGYYSEAFFSDSLKFYDNNIEGILLKLNRPKAYFELGCDWMGQYSKLERERFMVFSAGAGKIFPFLSLGYSAYMYHFANSGTVKGVVDNFLVNPYVKADFGYMLGIQELSLRAGWIQAMSNDRLNVGHYLFSGGADAELEVRHWDAGIRNNFFYGNTVMPLYDITDLGGQKYGNRLYFGDPFYRINDDGTYGSGFYNRAELFYEPNIGGFLKVRLSAMFHFTHMKYAGCQQVVRLVFDLQELMNRK